MNIKEASADDLHGCTVLNCSPQRSPPSSCTRSCTSEGTFLSLNNKPPKAFFFCVSLSGRSSLHQRVLITDRASVSWQLVRRRRCRRRPVHRAVGQSRGREGGEGAGSEQRFDGQGRTARCPARRRGHSCRRTRTQLIENRSGGPFSILQSFFLP